MLVKYLPPDSALSRALNGGEPPWQRNEHLVADLWALWAKRDHPVRAEMVAREHAAQKWARLAALKAKSEKIKRRYGLG